MAQFDALSKVAIGQYLPTDSFLHRIDPRMKIIGYLALILAVTFSRSIGGVVCAILLTLAGLWSARIPKTRILRALLPPLPYLILIALLQILFNPQPGVPLLDLRIINITDASLLSAGMLMLRFVALILLLSLASFTISDAESIHGLESLLRPLSRIGLPTMDLVMVIQIALRFLPLLAISAERISKAQASRGADWGGGKKGLIARVRAVIPLIVPLLTTSLRRAESLASAMEARAYGVRTERISMHEYSIKKQDIVFILLVGLVFLLIIRL